MIQRFVIYIHQHLCVPVFFLLCEHTHTLKQLHISGEDIVIIRPLWLALIMRVIVKYKIILNYIEFI